MNEPGLPVTLDLFCPFSQEIMNQSLLICGSHSFIWSFTWSCMTFLCPAVSMYYYGCSHGYSSNPYSPCVVLDSQTTARCTRKRYFSILTGVQSWISAPKRRRWHYCILVFNNGQKRVRPPWKWQNRLQWPARLERGWWPWVWSFSPLDMTMSRPQYPFLHMSGPWKTTTYIFLTCTLSTVNCRPYNQYNCAVVHFEKC